MLRSTNDNIMNSLEKRQKYIATNNTFLQINHAVNFIPNKILNLVIKSIKVSNYQLVLKNFPI
ncbi:hypothetical protein C1645_783564 [Glomus cerebriforme]|uniref:Uncharacterized protein n=1 Tax=Glomus cerebriforme TaxID=658196 RepID=A0A397SPY9_9GLOM|nr:hypothetical protein C1645_783564 [Glomus cerebriforme]